MKPVFQRTACPKCNIKGHLEKDCWGQCKVCEGWGHQTKYCRQRSQASETAKAKAAKEKRKKLAKKRAAKLKRKSLKQKRPKKLMTYLRKL